MSAFRALRTLALASAFAVSAAMAQAAPVLATADNINGIVTDASGAAIIAAKNQPSG